MKMSKAEKIFMWVCFILGILCILYGIAVLRIASGTMFFMVWFAGGACLILLGFGIRAHIMRLLPSPLKAVLLVLLATGVICLCVTWILIGMHFHDKGNNKIDYLVVLGAQVKVRSQDELPTEDASDAPAIDQKGAIAPSTVLQYRLETAADYLRAHPDTICICSGGKSPLEPEAEGTVMARWLAQHGVDASRIVVEDQSTNTVENIQNSFSLIHEHGTSVGIVTNNFHVFRACAIAEKAIKTSSECAVSDVTGIAATSNAFYLPNNMLRESMGIVKDWVKGNL